MKTRIEPHDSNLVRIEKVAAWFFPFVALTAIGFSLDGMTAVGHHAILIFAGAWLGGRWPWRKNG